VFGKVPEIGIARDQRNIMIDAGLRDQRIRDFGTQRTLYQDGASSSGPLPIAGKYLKERARCEALFQEIVCSRVAQHFGKHDRRKA